MAYAHTSYIIMHTCTHKLHNAYTHTAYVHIPIHLSPLHIHPLLALVLSCVHILVLSQPTNM